MIEGGRDPSLEVRELNTNQNEVEIYLSELEKFKEDETEVLARTLKQGNVDDLLGELLVDFDTLVEKTENDLKMDAKWIEPGDIEDDENQDDVNLSMFEEEEEPIEVKQENKKRKKKEKKVIIKKKPRKRRKRRKKRGNVFDRLYKPNFRKMPELDETNTYIMDDRPNAYISHQKNSCFETPEKSYSIQQSSTERLQYIKEQTERTPAHVGPGSYQAKALMYQMKGIPLSELEQEEADQGNRILARERYGFGSSSQRFPVVGSKRGEIEFIVEKKEKD